MTLMWLLFAVFSALGKSINDLLRKESAIEKLDPVVETWLMRLIAAVLLLPLFLLDQKPINFTPQFWTALFVTGFLIIFTSICVLKAMSMEELSYLAPLENF